MYCDIKSSHPFKKVESHNFSTLKNTVFSQMDYSALALISSQKESLKTYTLVDRDNSNQPVGIYHGFSETKPVDALSFYSRLELRNRHFECAIKSTQPTVAHIFYNQEIIATVQKNYDIINHQSICPTFKTYHQGNLLSTLPIDFEKNSQKMMVHRPKIDLEFQLQSSNHLHARSPNLVGTLLRKILKQRPSRLRFEKLFLGTPSFNVLSTIEMDILLYSILVIKSEFMPHDFPD
jgi:hypothetical protein